MQLWPRIHSAAIKSRIDAWGYGDVKDLSRDRTGGNSTGQALAMLDSHVRREAYVLAYIDAFWIVAWILTASLLLLLFLHPPPNPPLTPPRLPAS